MTNQHKETERGMEDITAKSAGSGVVGRPCKAGQGADAGHMQQQQDGQ